MVCVFVNSEEPPIYYVPDIPTGQNGMQTPEYIECLRYFTLELQNRGLDPSDIIYQQVLKTVYFQRPYIFKDRIFSKTVYFQGPYIFKDRIFYHIIILRMERAVTHPDGHSTILLNGYQKRTLSVDVPVTIWHQNPYFGHQVVLIYRIGINF